MLPSPEQTWFFWPAATEGRAQDSEHVTEGTAICRFGYKNRFAQSKDDEGHTKADGRDDVANKEANILLNIRYSTQRENRSKINTPVEPVKEPTRCLRTSILYLWEHTSQKHTCELYDHSFIFICLFY